MEYKTEKECNKCSTDSFISDCSFNAYSNELCDRYEVLNACISLEPSEIVEHCIDYNIEKQCVKCTTTAIESYFLDEATNNCQLT